MIALDDDRFLTLERSFSTGVGNAIKVYETTLAGATDVGGVADLDSASYTPAQKNSSST